MKDVDFFDNNPEEIPIFKKPQNIKESLVARKEKAIVGIIEKIEGKMVTNEEAAVHGMIRPLTDRSEMFYWKGNPVLLMRWWIVGKNLKFTAE
jgi:hypothetical protein